MPCTEHKFVVPKSPESYSAHYCCNEVMFVRGCNASGLETGYLCNADSMLVGMLMLGTSKFLNRLAPLNAWGWGASRKRGVYTAF